METKCTNGRSPFSCSESALFATNEDDGEDVVDGSCVKPRAVLGTELGASFPIPPPQMQHASLAVFPKFAYKSP